MSLPGGPEYEPSHDLEGRWEDVLHGRSSPEEVDSVLREIVSSGSAEKFEAQAEVYAVVRGHSEKYEIPTDLRIRLRQLVDARKRNRFGWTTIFWTAAASVATVLLLSFLTLRFQSPPERNLFAIIAQDARAEYQRALLDPSPVQTGSTSLNKIQGWFEPRVEFRPLVFFKGNHETILEGGRVGYISGVKVPDFLYRWQGNPIVLVILPAKRNPLWSPLPRRKWVAVIDDKPTASVWRRGDFIYAIVGNAPVNKLREISRYVTPKDKNF